MVVLIENTENDLTVAAVIADTLGDPVAVGDGGETVTVSLRFDTSDGVPLTPQESVRLGNHDLVRRCRVQLWLLLQDPEDVAVNGRVTLDVIDSDFDCVIVDVTVFDAETVEDVVTVTDRIGHS